MMAFTLRTVLKGAGRKVALAALMCFLACTAMQAKPKTRVACVGNSITYGTGIADREHYSYPVQLQRLLGDNYVVGNFGRPSATLLRHGHFPYFEQKEFQQAMQFKGDIVVIHLGINDTDPRNWPNYRDEFVTDYLALIDSLRSANHNARIILARMTPIARQHPRFISGTKAWHTEIQQAIETVAKVSGAELIDFHAPLYAHPDLLPDAIHPNAEGAGILARTVYGGITGDYGGLQMSEIYTDGMVLQREVPLEISGKANAGKTVKVSFAGQRMQTVADNRGDWSVTLQPLKAVRNQTLTIESEKVKKTYRDVAVGEVWLCSGQSNMSFTLQQAVTAASDVPNATDADLRFFDMKERWPTTSGAWPESAIDSTNHLQYYIPTTWHGSTPETAKRFSAVAYYFGRMLRDSLNVPVGLVCNAVGGSPTESWIDRNTLETQFPAILTDWMHNDFVQPWVRGRAIDNVASATGRPARHPYEPCYLYECGMLPLLHYGFKGVVWYQGESNAHNVETHEQLFKLLVNSWRTNLNNKDLPFYYVQLSSLNRPSWPWFRDSQLRLMRQLPGVGMAVTSDIGDSLDVHPRHKLEVGERLARWALCKTYDKNVVPSGPLYSKAWREGNAAVVEFDYADGLTTSDGKPLRTFEVAEIDGLFYPAEAKVEGNRVRLTSEKVAVPHFVRYAWQPFTRANMVNSEGLPASTFRAEF